MRAFAIVMALVLSLSWPCETAAYAVLAHEAIIDSVWDTNIRPLLLKRFPGATAEDIKEAHGYAYGGAIIQDMGYYPHGSFFFSDLTHYVRYRDLLNQVGTGQPALPNDNFDTGEITGPGKYRLNDETHAKWLHALAEQNFSGASSAVRAELLEFFGHPDAPYATKQKPKDWATVQADLQQLKKAPPVVTGKSDEGSL